MNIDPFAIIHLCCYLVCLIPSVYVIFQIDYLKFMKPKNNLAVYMLTALIGMGLTYLAGEFLYHLITMFIA